MRNLLIAALLLQCSIGYTMEESACLIDGNSQALPPVEDPFDANLNVSLNELNAIQYALAMNDDEEEDTSDPDDDDVDLKPQQNNNTAVHCNFKICPASGVTIINKNPSAAHFTCTQCGNVYETQMGLRSHEHSHKTNIAKQYRYKCSVCQQQFTQLSSYTQHMNAHNGVTPYQCLVSGCNARFSAMNARQRHMMAEHPKQFRCPEKGCKQSFENKELLNAHAQIHQLNAPNLVCNICKITFSTFGNRTRHDRAVHEKKTPHQCTVCNRGFARKEILIGHSCHGPTQKTH